MIVRIVFFISYILISSFVFAQSKTYKDSIESYFRKYVKEHEVVHGKEKEFMAFFPVNEKLRMSWGFERTMNSP